MTSFRGSEGLGALPNGLRVTDQRMTRVRSAAREWLRLIPGQRPSAPPPRVEDEALIDAIERGDRGLGDALYARLVRVVDSTVYRVVGPGDPEHEIPCRRPSSRSSRPSSGGSSRKRAA